ncbi:MAG: hypothetical protein GY936_14355, partial [Ignavibacteriae bacterium]|nr:hypothetical protein [Ignavibacteriota bacterium]
MKNNIYFKILLVIAFFLLMICGECVDKRDIRIINMVENIDSIPVSISFQNKMDVNNNGGHLQGVQYYKYNQNEYLYLSGSSDSNSYYSIVKMGVESSVISVNNILPKPYKHAGGFQISNNIMAIGVEDNSARDKSKVFIYGIDNPEKPPEEPLTIIERNGEEKRATAGCVGIIAISDYILVVVGDWDTENLDFYRININMLGTEEGIFKHVHSIDMKKTNKSYWINDNWLPYQNINFIKDSSENLYLAGMASNDNNENILDVFRIESIDYSKFSLTKILTKK